MILFKSYFRILVICGFFPLFCFADSYAEYSTAKIYSKNKKYLVRVTEKKKATLFFIIDKKITKKWSIQLPFLPQSVIATNDGKRVIIIDHYYGNSSQSEATVVLILDEKGNSISSYKLKDFLVVSNLVQTTSTAHWRTATKLSNNEKELSISTAISKAEASQCVTVPFIKECMQQKPFEELIFDLTTGLIIERRKL